MTDRELLEDAVKAAEIDDGAALRLAAKLALFESFDFTLKLSAACSEDDPCAATRRAIGRAAAEILKDMP
jgi:hypothetical protein